MLRGLLAASLLCAAAPELGSQITETMTMNTYYPAASGVYSQLTTTNQTFLARDAGSVVTIGAAAQGTAKLSVFGNVGIQTFAPVAALHVEGNMTFATDGSIDQVRGVSWDGNSRNGSGFWYGINREPGGWVYPYPDLKIDFHTGLKVKAHSGYNAVSIWEDWCDTGMDNCAAGGTGYGSEMAKFRISAYGGSYVLSNLSVGAAQNPQALLDVAGEGIGILRQVGGNCRAVAYNVGSGGACNGGEYATNQMGIMSRYGGSSLGAGTMYCCRCPYGSCPTLP